jgi:sugar transferase (PEP-CTERM/EpsH1 system associated)
VNILFVTQRVPYPPDRGDKLRAYHELRALAVRGHRVHLLAFADDRDEVRHEASLREICASVRLVPIDRPRAMVRALAGLAQRSPLSLAYFRSGRMLRAVERALWEVRPSAVFVCSSSMAQYVPRDLASRAIIDLVDVDSEKWAAYARRGVGPRAWVYRLESRRLRQYEQTLLSTAGSVIVSAEREAALLESATGCRSDTLHVITNGVDLEHFRPSESAGSGASGAKLLFTGVMDYLPNVDAVRYYADSVLPLVRSRRPDAELVVVGRNPTRQVRRLGSRAGIRIVGGVPDMRPYFMQATASVLPLRIARGVQNKLLEAMACGRAIVATPQVAAGLNVVPGEDLLVATNGQELAEASLRVLNDEELRARLGRRARLFVQRQHQWEPLMNRLSSLVEAVAAA